MTRNRIRREGRAAEGQTGDNDTDDNDDNSDHDRDRSLDIWCFEPSQPPKITPGPS